MGGAAQGVAVQEAAADGHKVRSTPRHSHAPPPTLQTSLKHWCTTRIAKKRYRNMLNACHQPNFTKHTLPWSSLNCFESPESQKRQKCISPKEFLCGFRDSCELASPGSRVRHGGRLLASGCTLGSKHGNCLRNIGLHLPEKGFSATKMQSPPSDCGIPSVWVLPNFMPNDRRLDLAGAFLCA